MSFLTRSLYCFLNCCTFHWALFLFVSINFSRGFNRLVFHCCFAAFLLKLFDVYYQSMLAVYLLATGQGDLLRESVDLFIYHIVVDIFNRDHMILFGVTCFFLHTVNVAQYACYQLGPCLLEQIIELVPLMEFHIDNKFTLLDCLFRRDFIRKIKQSIEEYSGTRSLVLETPLTPQDRRKVFLVCKYVEALSLVTTNFLLSCFGFLILTQSFFHRENLPMFDFVYFRTMFNSLFYGFFLFIMCWASTFMSVSFVLSFTIRRVPLFHLTNQLFVIRRQLDLESSKLQKKSSRILSKRKPFITYLLQIVRNNQFECSTLFSRAINLTILSNLIFVNKLILDDISPYSWILVIILLTFQCFIALTVFEYMIRAPKQLYRASKVYTSYSAWLAQSSTTKSILQRIRLSNFIELIHTKKRYFFRIQPVGGITRNNLILRFIPLYTSLCLFVIGFISKH